MSKVRTTRKLYGIAGALMVPAVPYLMLVYNSSETIESAQSFCPFKMLTGFPCPGCGITKSLVFFLEGDFYKSVYYHLFGPFTILFCIITVVVLTAELVTKKEYFQNILYNKKIAYFLGATLAIYHFSRLVVFVSTNNLDDILRQSIWK